MDITTTLENLYLKLKSLKSRISGITKENVKKKKENFVE